ncbi:hypothetical protein Tco_1341760 [Tanacetum coccineum]
MTLQNHLRVCSNGTTICQISTRTMAGFGVQNQDIMKGDVKPYWKEIKKAKACILAKAQASNASSKAKVEARGSKAKLQASTKTLIVKSHIRITNCVLGLANAKTRDAIKGKTFGVKIQ